MVSKRIVNKYLPHELVMPGAHVEISFIGGNISDKKRKNLEEVARNGQVIFDIKTKEFYVKHEGKRYDIKYHDKDPIPEYMLNRIKIELPEGLLPTDLSTIGIREYKEDRFCYFNPFSRSWITPKFQPVPTAYEERLYSYLAGLFKEEIIRFNSERSRIIRKKNVDRLSKFIVKSLANFNIKSKDKIQNSRGGI